MPRATASTTIVMTMAKATCNKNVDSKIKPALSNVFRINPLRIKWILK